MPGHPLRCAHSARRHAVARRRTQGEVASRRHGPCAEQGQSSGGLFLHISWANVGKMPTFLEVGKMPTLLEGPSRSGGVPPPFAHVRSKSSRLAAFFLLISWAKCGQDAHSP